MSKTDRECVWERVYKDKKSLSVFSHTPEADMCVRSPLTGCQSESHCWDALNLSQSGTLCPPSLLRVKGRVCCLSELIFLRAVHWVVSQWAVRWRQPLPPLSSSPLSLCPSIPPCGKSPAHHMFSEESIQNQEVSMSKEEGLNRQFSWNELF